MPVNIFDDFADYHARVAQQFAKVVQENQALKEECLKLREQLERASAEYFKLKNKTYEVNENE